VKKSPLGKLARTHTHAGRRQAATFALLEKSRRRVSKDTLLKIINEYRNARAKLLLSLEDGDSTLNEEPS